MMRHLSIFAVALMLTASACNPSSTSTTPTMAKPTTNQGPPPPPCHPGCFPAGTLIATPDGPRPIETIQTGDVVLLIDREGTSVPGAVEAVFQTCNRLLEVQTETGTLRTTPTQPLCLEAGGFRRAGELAAGDFIWRFEGAKRQATRVQAIVPTESEEMVYNLVVGESAVFVAGGYLARGKPPAVSTASPETK